METLKNKWNKWREEKKLPILLLITLLLFASVTGIGIVCAHNNTDRY